MYDFNHNGAEDSLDAFIENEISTEDIRGSHTPYSSRSEKPQRTPEEQLAWEFIKTFLWIVFLLIVIYW